MKKILCFGSVQGFFPEYLLGAYSAPAAAQAAGAAEMISLLLPRQRRGGGQKVLFVQRAKLEVCVGL